MLFSFEPVSHTRVKITDGYEKQIVIDGCETGTHFVRAKTLPGATLDSRGRIKGGQY